MATLNSTYQYIGRSNAVSCPAGWNYYILLYAKTSGDIATGNQYVSILMRMACNTNSTFYGWSTTAYAKAGGVTAFSWSKQQIPNSAWNSSSLSEGGYTYARWIDIGEGTAVVNAGFGVAKQITIEGSWVMNDSYSKDWFPYTGRYATASISVTLPMLASASTISSVGNVTLGNACSVTWTPQSASFRYRLRFECGSWVKVTDPIHPNKTSAYTYTGQTIPLEEKTAGKIPGKTGTATVYLYTYSDAGASYENMVGSADSEQFTVTVPENSETKPTISMSLSPVSSLKAPFDSLYIQGKSKVKGTLSFDLKFNAMASASCINVDGTDYGSPYESGVLSQAGVRTVKAAVRDSRGHYDETSDWIPVIPYSRPKVQAVSGERNVVAARCDKDGNLSDSGTYLKIKAQRSYEKVIAYGDQKNFCELRFRYKSASASSYSAWTTILAKNDTSVDYVNTDALLDGLLATDTSYVVQIQAIDDIGEHSEATINIPTEDIYWHRTKNGLGLGKYCEGENLLDVDWDAKFGKSINGLYIKTVYVNTTSVIRLQSSFAQWKSSSVRQNFFVFGNANTVPIMGVFSIVESGAVFSSSINHCTVTCEEGGVVKLELGSTAWDDFAIMSARPFSIL